ncbi:OmpA family protein [Flavilitoribacter nigricans]|uniref:OmpA-like domain-containing protein n=1 Tax=Flavilitoribacter nigricans (strain ATCC 23147 / DSM 23189 / NBRC 102662 / NCIMB 1420 / SS-2) TaxID=1122177 RepID=A0A2D0MXY8_FLAN2|nr:OmpA family protein [Flavilitoribacter nigricans]PHN00998.1 hypothetical protein CRP01_39360 [Flavilitoribacter nigricans DSM 23189 = NBRC 102662]
MRTLIFLFVGGLVLSSCVSSKKFKETVGNLNAEHQAKVSELETQLTNLRAEKDKLTMDLAESRGGNQALLATQDKLQERIDRLQAEVENIGSKASNQEQSLNSEISRKSNEISALEQRLAEVKGTINRWENAQEAIAREISIALQTFDSTLYAVDQRGGEVVVVMNENMVFRPGSTSRFEQQGIDALQAVSAILSKYPSLYIQVVGHTDNRDVARKSLDNWDYCLLRAGNVAKLLIDEFDVGANRILPAGKGEFAPRTSNETSEGRAANRRIELVLTGSGNDLAREIKREIDK